MLLAIADTLRRAELAAVADSLGRAGGVAEHGEQGENMFSELLHHLQDTRVVDFPGGHWALPTMPPLQVGGLTIDLSVTKHVVFVIAAAVIVAILMITAAKRNARQLVPRGLGNFIEVFVVFIRDEVAIANMGSAGVKYTPYLLTTFFFILTMNLFGLLPYGASATSNISVTAGLAGLAFIMIQISAMRSQGVGHYLSHLTGGVHWLLWPIMVPIEIIGLFTKPFALCVRLWANMTGGHIVIVALIGLIFIFKSYIIAPVPVLFTLGINMLEMFVALLQAYIFTMLTAVFMGLGMQPAHDEHQEHAH